MIRDATRNTPPQMPGTPLRLILFLLGIALLPARAENTVFLRGVVDVEGLRAALIEVAYSVPGKLNENRSVTRLMHQGDVLETETTPGQNFRLDVVSIDASQMKVTVKENNVAKDYAIPPGQGAWAIPGTTRLALANAQISDVVDLLSLLTDRVVLFHPEGSGMMTPQLVSRWTNNVVTKTQVARVLEMAWLHEGDGVSSTPVGNSFLILCPASLTNQLASKWKSPAPAGPPISPFTLHNFPEAAAKYGDLTGQPAPNLQPKAEPWIYFRTLNPITKTEATWATRTLLDWAASVAPHTY
jgi:hypothetical protein